MKIRSYFTNVVIFIFFSFALSGCDDKNLKDVNTKIQIIQNQYNNQKFDVIYDQSSEGFKKIASKDGFVDFMNEKFKSLGKLKNSKILFSQEKSGSIVNITYLSVYDKYTLAEDITFKDEENGQGFRLFQYTIDTGGKIVPVTKTGNSVRIDTSATFN